MYIKRNMFSVLALHIHNLLLNTFAVVKFWIHVGIIQILKYLTMKWGRFYFYTFSL